MEPRNNKVVDLVGEGQLKRVLKACYPLEKAPCPSLPPCTHSMDMVALRVLGPILAPPSGWLWLHIIRFRRKPAGPQGPPCASLPNTSLCGYHSTVSGGWTRIMIYNPFQGIIAANGPSQFVLSKKGEGKIN